MYIVVATGMKMTIHLLQFLVLPFFDLLYGWFKIGCSYVIEYQTTIIRIFEFIIFMACLWESPTRSYIFSIETQSTSTNKTNKANSRRRGGYYAISVPMALLDASDDVVAPVAVVAVDDDQDDDVAIHV